MFTLHEPARVTRAVQWALTGLALAALAGSARAGNNAPVSDSSNPSAQTVVSQNTKAQKPRLKEGVTTLPPVTVHGTGDDAAVELTAFELNLAPSVTGTLTEALRGQSRINFDRDYGNPARAADVAAPLISIYGSKPYENHYAINGMDNNNTLNPGTTYEDRTYLVLDPTGDSNNLMLQTDLVESLAVYSENIPVMYGDFTGGVVDARLRNAAVDKWHGSVSVTHTDSAWGTEKTQGQGKATFKRSRGTVTLEGSVVKDKVGALLAYSRHQSQTPIALSRHFAVEAVGHRRHENLMLRVNTADNQPVSLGATFIWAPYQAESFREGSRNGRYRLIGGGWSLLLDSKADFKGGQWSLDLGYAHNEVSRKHDANRFFFWLLEPNGKASRYATWFEYFNGWATEGGYGDSDRTQDMINAKAQVQWDAFNWGGLEHRITAGVDLTHRSVDYDRQGYIFFRNPTADARVQGSLDDGVVSGEQYSAKRTVSHPVSGYKKAHTAALYAQDEIRLERFTIRPGLRIGWDSVGRNTDVAPSLMLDADLLNDGRFHLTAGANRYYGTQILGSFFANRFHATTQTRTVDNNGQLTPWSKHDLMTQGVKRRLGALKTPYSDELTLGATAQLNRHVALHLTAVKRDYKKQLSTKKVSDDPRYDTELTNDGASHYKGLVFCLDANYDLGVFGRHVSELGATVSRVSGSETRWLTSWNNAVEEGLDPDHVLLDGKKIARSAMPASNFNPAWVLTYAHTAAFWHDRLRTQWLFRMEGKSDTIDFADPDVVDGMESFVTFKIKRRAHLDLNAELDLYKKGDTVVTLSAQVLNLLDQTKTVYKPDGISWYGPKAFTEMGRQYYIGLKAAF